MGMTYCLNIRNDNIIESENNDFPEIHRATDKLDKVCKKFGVTKISELVDLTELARDCDDELETSEEDQQYYDELEQLYGEGKRPYPISEMQWHDSANGLNTIKKLKEYINKNPAYLKLKQENMGYLQEEFSEIILILEKAVANKQTFHFEVLN